MESQTKNGKGGGRRITAATCKLQLVGTDACNTDTCTRAHPRWGLRPVTGGQTPGGAREGRGRGPGPTHHERRGAQRRAAGGSMPERAGERASNRGSAAGPRAAAPAAGRGRQAAQSRADAAQPIRGSVSVRQAWLAGTLGAGRGWGRTRAPQIPLGSLLWPPR